MIKKSYEKAINISILIEKVLNQDINILIKNIDYIKTNQDLILKILKLYLKLDKNNQYKIKPILNFIIMNKKDYIIINDIEKNLNFFKYLQNIGYFISYKKDLLNFNKGNYSKLIKCNDYSIYKKAPIIFIHLKTLTHDKDNRYFIIPEVMYNDYKALSNISCIKKDIHNDYIYYDKSYLYHNKGGKIRTKNNYNIKTINRSKLIECLNQYYNYVYVNDNTYKNMFIINDEYTDYLNLDIFSLLHDYFSYYHKKISIIEFLNQYNIDIINDLEKTNNNEYDNSTYYKVFINNDLKIIKSLNINEKDKTFLINLFEYFLNDIPMLKYQDIKVIQASIKNKCREKVYQVLMKKLQVYNL